MPWQAPPGNDYRQNPASNRMHGVPEENLEDIRERRKRKTSRTAITWGERPCARPHSCHTVLTASCIRLMPYARRAISHQLSAKNKKLMARFAEGSTLPQTAVRPTPQAA